MTDAGFRQIRHVTPETVDAGVSILATDGVVVVDRLFSEEHIDSIMAELAPHLAATRAGGGEFYGGRAKRVSGLLAKAPAFAAVLARPELHKLTTAALGAYCDRYVVALTAALEVWPGGTLQPLHRDEGTYGKYLDYTPGGPEYLVSFMVAGTDFTAENGATRFVVGSHAGPTNAHVDEAMTAQATMPKGSIAVWLGSTLHGMAVNHTTLPRTGFVGGFCLGWLRQEENQYLACPPDVAARFTDEVQQLLGYTPHSALLGWATDCDHRAQTRPAPASQRDEQAAAAAASTQHGVQVEK
jgi:ectoine hydroxylase-related dioxygenase (phytanoyl-CoA dioxygenase family)